jgi:tetratricopeptide (TPR) repeat protein
MRKLALLFLALATPLLAAPRPLSDAERAAVEMVAEYLARGPVAISQRLASASPLASLPEPLKEIEARLGPVEDAQWELQTVVPALADRMAAFSVTWPSGYEEHVVFDLVSEGGAFKVQSIRTLADETSIAAIIPLESETAPVKPEAVSSRNVSVALALLGIALSASSALLARKRRLSLAMLAGSLALIGGASWLAYSEDRAASIAEASVAATTEETSSITQLAKLADLRRTLIAGGDVEAQFKAADRTGGRGAVADLWKIQNDIVSLRTKEAKQSLDRFKSPASRPLVELLRARLALLDNDEVTAALAFERAVNLGPGRDAVWYEHASVLLGLGFEDQARAAFERLARMGSRDADVYYSLAVLSAFASKDEDVEKYLKQAWALRPAERQEILDSGVFWPLLRKPEGPALISFSAAAEPVVQSPSISTRPIVLPQEASARTSGDHFQIAVGTRALIVPGGAALAPPGTLLVAATAWASAEDQRRLEEAPSLLSVARNPGAWAQPAMRERITATALTLAKHNRWPDIVSMTDGLSPTSEHVPPVVFFLRSIGLNRLERGDESKRVLTQVASSPVLQRRRDADALAQLAELFAAHDLFDAAVRMYDRSQAIRPNPFIDDRVRQIQMNRRLATSYSVERTEHFEIRFPKDEMSEASAVQLGEVMEKEFKRLRNWIPVPDFKPVVVNVVSWEEFRSTYTGSDYILGFYNGKITVPFAGVAMIDPVIGILAHELAHAMIAQATADQAPRWFQEGLAQRIENRPFFANAFNTYDDSRLIPISLLDSVLGRSPDPSMITAAYIVAQTDIRYLEEKYGRGGLAKLMAAFREGAHSDEALRRVTGKSLEEVELELRQWGRAEQRVFEGDAR